MVTLSTTLGKVGGFRIGYRKKITGYNCIWLIPLYFFMLMWQFFKVSFVLMFWCIYASCYGVWWCCKSMWWCCKKCFQLIAKLFKKKEAKKEA